MKKIFFYTSLSNKPKNQRGFTLIEQLIYMGLLSIFLITLTEMFVSILNVRKESEAVSAVEQDGRFIMARLAYDINRADSITTPAAPGASSSSLGLIIGGVTYTYVLNGTNLQLTTNVGTNSINSLGSSINTVSFQRIGNNNKDTIKITMTANGTTITNKGIESMNFVTTVGRR